MAPPEIPGFYYDPYKRRYFKVENSKTAPTNAAWSSDNVKKRKFKDREAVTKSRRLELDAKRIAPPPIMRDLRASRFLKRETGEDIRDFAAVSFARDIVEMGHVPSGFSSTSSNLRHLALSTNCSVAVTSLDGDNLKTTHFVTNPNTQRVSWDPTSRTRSRSQSSVSCIKYSKKLHGVLIVCDDLSSLPYVMYDPGLWFREAHFERSVSLAGIQLGPDQPPVQRHSRDMEYFAGYFICPSTENNDTVALIGTDRGLVSLTEPMGLRYITPISGRNSSSYTTRFRDIFAIDYQVNHHSTFFMGGRPGQFHKGDLREAPMSWDSMTLPNSIAHIKSVSDYQVLVAGLNNMLSIFDLRYCRYSPASDDNPYHKALPLLNIPGYKNMAHFTLGFDFDKDTGVVAAAHDDGKVALYSVRDGRRLPSPVIDAIHSGYGPIHCIQMQALPGDNMPRLFMGEDNQIKVYSVDASK